MARQFTSQDAKQLLNVHRTWRTLLERNAGYADKQKAVIASVAANLLARHVFMDYAQKQLASGDESAPLSKDLVQLIRPLYFYIKSLPLSKESSRVYRDTQDKISTALADLKPGTGGIQWLFASGKNKARAADAYAYLRETQNDSYAWLVQSLNKEIEQLDQQTDEMVLQEFERDRTAYQSALYDVVPTLSQMASGGTSREIEQLCRQYKAFAGQIEAAQSRITKDQDQIQRAAERMAAVEVLKLLRSIPVEELGRERQGLRFKALKEQGYETVGDVFCATAYNLASIYGISEDMAYTMKQCANQYAEQAKQGTKIRLSVDEKSKEATTLIVSICAYRSRTATRDALEEIQRRHSNAISEGLRNIQAIGVGIDWVFAETDQKKKSIESYQYLQQLLKGDYGKQVNALCDALIRPVQIDAAAAWDDFAHNTIAYFHVLEDIVPGILGNDDRLYGLPEDLAREIQEECFFPDGLKCDLRRYQEWGVKYILHQGRVLLGDEMGLGKTIQAIAAMVSLRNTGATHFLVVCPASVLSNWCKEIAEKSKLRVTKIHGQGRMNAFKEWQRTGGAGVTTFETTGYLVMEAEERFHLMIVDEAHYIKNGEARRTVNVKRIGEHADRMLFMTGTALENKVDEMISLVTILQPTVAAKLHDYAFMSSAPQFREKIAPVYYRRKREDVLTELPELIENNEWCALWGEEERVYERTVLEEHYMTIRRVSWNVGDLNQSSKAKRMKEIIEEAEADGRKTIVFSFFLDTISKIRDFLGSRCTQPINGTVSLQRRQEIIDEFDKAPAGTVLLAQIQSGGTGLNIQSASVVILCEPQLKPSIENQAISRAYRMGQARNVLVYRLLCEDTIDERIMDMLAQKQAVFDAFADQSVAAVATAREEIALDDKTMGKLVKEEIERINAKRSGIASAGKPTYSAVMDAVAQ